MPDSLRGRSYDYFLDQFEDKIDGDRARVYSAALLHKAKSEDNAPQMVNAYRIILHQVAKGERIQYADSLILAAKRSGDDRLAGNAHLTKGIIYYDLKNYSNALDNYLIADEHAQKTDDDYLHNKIRYHIAQIKYYLGFYDEAAALLSDCVAYFREADAIPYLTSLHSLSLCYNRLGQYDSCTATNDLGIEEAERLKFYDAIPRFVNSEGINQYFKKNYPISLAKLTETLPALRTNNDIAGETVTQFYLGKNYWAMNRPEKAITYLQKVDEAFVTENFIRPDLREAYEMLISYYRHSGEMPLQLKYIDRLLLADRYIDSNFRYLSGRIHKEYDTKKLEREKAAIEKSLRLREQLILSFGIVILLLIGFSIYALYKMGENKRRFKKLMARHTRPRPISPAKNPVGEGNLDINPDVVAAVLKQLEKFEEKEKYLAKDITLNKVAKMFDSNIVYVSKIIAYHRQKKFIDYINDLKIEYIIRLLNTNTKFRKYTNKALADEAGFSTTQHFTRAFFKNTGISPTYFIKKLNP